MNALLDRLRQGDRRCLARAMSIVAGTGPDARRLQDALRTLTGQVPWWGFTGPPGVGKSTLIDALLALLRDRGRRVGVVAVDPTSPLSDGALLGDRVRMMRHAVDPDVFIRSLATHGREGGLSDATLHCARLLELAGYDPILIETVGVGQNEVDVAAVADLCVVVLGPGHGDDIQLIKAGLLEVANLVVVNKCDLPEARRLLAEARTELAQARPESISGREPLSLTLPGNVKGQFARTPDQPDDSADEGGPRGDVLPVEAKNGTGVAELLDRLLTLDADARSECNRQRIRRRRLVGEIRRHALLKYEEALTRALAGEEAATLLARLGNGEVSLDSAAAQLPLNL